MSVQIERVVDRRVRGQKSLSGISGLEPEHLSLSIFGSADASSSSYTTARDTTHEYSGFLFDWGEITYPLLPKRLTKSAGCLAHQIL